MMSAPENLESEAGRHRRRAPSHFDSDLDGFEDFAHRGPSPCGLIDVPLHARLAVGFDGDTHRNEVVGLLRYRTVRERCFLDVKEGLIDLRLRRLELRMSLLPPARNLLDLVHHLGLLRIVVGVGDLCSVPPKRLGVERSGIRGPFDEPAAGRSKAWLDRMSTRRNED